MSYNFQDVLLREKQGKKECICNRLLVHMTEGKIRFPPKEIQKAKARNESNWLFTKDG